MSGAAPSGALTSTPSTSRGTTSDPCCTDAMTVAITIGEARMVPCPISCAAAPVSLSVSGSVLPKYAGKPRSWSRPMPRETAASNRFVPDSFGACEMKAVLHELATAVLNGMSPSALAG